MKIKNRIKTTVSLTAERLFRHSRIFREQERVKYIQANKIAQLEKDNIELRERTAAISQRLCSKLEVQRPEDPMRRRLRVCIEIDSMILERGFLHGDDATVIEYIGRDIGARAAHEIRRANFSRWER